MTKEEFCRRFVDRMMSRAGREEFEPGISIRDYAQEVAEVCCDEQGAHLNEKTTPEDEADTDISYWEED